MPRFPRSETDIIALSDEMLAGLERKKELFPNADLKGLTKFRAAYQATKDTQMEIFQRYKDATDVKDAALEELIVKMKLELKQAEVDAANDPVKLSAIGWGGSTPVEDLQPPGPPRNLEVTIEGDAAFLDWKQPARNAGGKVQVYEIERRTMGRSDWGPWAIAATAFETAATLPGLPKGVEIELRVRTKNKKGQSAPTEAVAVKI